MKTILSIALTLLVLTISVQAYRQVLIGNHYQSLSAFHKINKVQTMISQDSAHADWYSKLKLAELFVQDNDKAFDNTADDMPCGIIPFTLRPKLIHTVGLTANVAFKSNGKHPFTGIFKGADNGILRLSLAGQPQDNTIIPGFVFKFFRNGVPSANIFSMYGLAGQDNNSNVFAHDMTTHVPNLNSKAPLPLKMLAKDFEKTSDWPNHLGFSNAAQHDQNGNEEKNIDFPFRIVFHPTLEAHKSMKNDLKIDEYYFTEVMQGLKVDHLFEVYAQFTPNSDDLTYIGDVYMKSAFTTSTFGDEKLYFQHQRVEDDFKYKPEWEDALEALNQKQASIIPQFYYPDIGYKNEKIQE